MSVRGVFSVAYSSGAPRISSFSAKATASNICYFLTLRRTARSIIRGVRLSPSRDTHTHRKMVSDSNSNTGLTDIGSQTKHGITNESLVTWRARIDESIAKSRKVRGGNFVQICTVYNNEPRCRTVVFRGFQKLPIDNPVGVQCGGKPCVMKMITDNRSNKVSQGTANSAAELVWWFQQSNEQYRIKGQLVFVGSGDFANDDSKEIVTARKEQWGNLSDSAREQFYWQAPGLPYTGESPVPKGGRDAEGKIMDVPDTFLLLLLQPSQVDYLRLGDNYRQIDVLSGEEWIQQRANP
ncbi:hypothetical protein SARC_07895 [Sphaeroforma arctica JP610]|uniref:Pyridoxamine 5'-phosphate oxidase Alr4036 family FMN-binding domain-containing protein n=1 Tax=Sphaeroforma arctica JP610 TaxID=667725 RepID=A0A0L0FSI3_9EUKA|nr:hypothetical protein SARC_07895 [Sphaeroforma arctica JP610]KNC79720.1 hypothetical protein SARC_07895 [Sphaeroforma arctica JP610]|eukprot:XP_014153622.1 hypothetical protein SARC_07895 [Sphaeroforma arctica JP610]